MSEDSPLSTRWLDDARVLAIVGLSRSPHRDSFTVSRYLQSVGYELVGVHPGHDEVLGSPCFPTLSEIPADLRQRIDVVVVFRRPDAVPELLSECAELDLRRVWLQIGVSSPEAIELARELGIDLVHDQCIRVVHSVHART